MIRKYLAKAARSRALKHGKGAGLWRKLSTPSLDDWSAYLKAHGGLQHMGDHCSINPSTTFTTPYLTSLGNNVRIAGAWLGGHDGSVNMLNRAYGTNFDAVAPIVIEDNVFIGVHSIIMMGAHIGPNTIVGAGSLVSGKIEGNCVVAGNPARVIRSMDEHLERMKKRSDAYPWKPLIDKRNSEFDPAMEPELRRLRVKHFFGETS